MADPILAQRRILVVEDEYLLAEALSEGLGDIGAVVVGPAATVADALALIDSGVILDAAILDANLGGESSVPVAARLMERGVPVLLTTGYDVAALPPALARCERCEKPASFEAITRKLGGLLQASGRP